MNRTARCRVSEGARLRWLLGVAMLLFLSLVTASTPARAARLHLVHLVQGAAVIDEQSATPNFPDSVDFRLKAHNFKATRAQLNYRLVGDSITEEEQAVVAGTSDAPDLKLALDLTTHYLPPGSAVEYYWTLQDAGGQTEDTPVKTFKLLDGRHDWQDLTDAQKRVTVRWYKGNTDFGNNLLTVASTSLDRLQTEIKTGLQRPAEIWVYATQDDLLKALPKNVPEWVGGKAFPDLALVLAAIDDDSSASMEIDRVVPHELSHLVLYQATRNPYNSPPAWFDEGLAVHNQGVQDPAEQQALQGAAVKGALIPLKSLSGSFGADPDTATLSYAESRSAIDFLLSDGRYGPEKFSRSVAAFRNGVTYDEAFKAGLGVGVDDIDAQWRASLPYKQGASQPGGQGTTQSKPNPLSRLGGLLILVPVVAFSVLFLAGGLLAVVLLLKRRRDAAARATHGNQQPPTQ